MKHSEHMDSKQIDQPVEVHLQHPLFQNALASIDEGARIINCDPNVITRLKRPKRIGGLKAEFPNSSN